MNAAWDESVQFLFATMGVQEAVAEFCCRSAPVVRKRMYKFYASAIDSINMATIIGSWDVSRLPNVGHLLRDGDGPDVCTCEHLLIAISPVRVMGI